MIDLLPVGMRIVAPDLRGFGRTKGRADRYGADLLVADLTGLCAKLGVDRVHLVGHDWGGWIAFQAGMLRPEMLASLTVLNAPHPWPRMRPALAGQAFDSWYALLNATPFLGPRLGRLGFPARLLIDRELPGLDRSTANRYLGPLKEKSRSAAVSALYRYYWRAFFTAAGGLGRTETLTPATRLIFGRLDSLISDQLVAQGLIENALNAEIEFIEQAGHFIVDQAPGLIAERIADQVALTN